MMQPTSFEPHIPPHSDSPYRPDIDGLRAVAVLSVLLFHAFPSMLPGGFVGVDIFFVISGYLITGNLLIKSERSALYLILDFYKRRIRRIFPALITVLCVTFYIGWNILYTKEFSLVGKNIASAATFTSNFTLWGESGYFDADSETKPLLHLWSLAIEEQFYFIWPILIWISVRLGLPPLILAVTCAILSFLYSLDVARGDQIQDFYSPLTRFWEILVGATLVIAERNHVFVRLRSMPLILSALGTGLIIISLSLIDGASPYPNWRAAVPVIGSTLVIAASTSSFINRVILGSKPLVAIGLISYPLYLWHWPLLAFARIVYGDLPPPEARCIILVLSLAFALFTFKIIEEPIRRGGNVRIKVAGLCAAMILIGIAGLDTWERNGLSFRSIAKNSPPTGLAALTRQNEFVRDCSLGAIETVNSWCYSDTREPPRYAVLGDSHGEALFWGLVRNSRPGGRWMIAARAGCAPLVGMERLTVNNFRDAPKADPAECAAFNLLALDHVIQSKTIRVAVIVTASRVLENDEYAPQIGQAPQPNGAYIGLSNAITRLEQAGKTVIFVEDNPYVANSEDCLPRLRYLTPAIGLAHKRCTIKYTDYMKYSEEYRHHTAELYKTHPLLKPIFAADILCDADKNLCSMMKDDQFLYSYGDHISDHGGDIISIDINKVLESLEELPPIESEGNALP